MSEREAAEAIREAAAKVAHGFTLEANQGANRLIVPASWAEMTPSDVYNLGANDAATFIREDIRALPLPEPPPDPREPRGCPTPGACSCIAPDPRDALIGTDVSDAAIADATIARLSSDLAAAREALAPFAAYAEWLSHLSDESNVLSFHRGRLDWLHLIAGDFRRARAVLAKLSKGA